MRDPSLVVSESEDLLRDSQKIKNASKEAIIFYIYHTLLYCRQPDKHESSTVVFCSMDKSSLKMKNSYISCNIKMGVFFYKSRDIPILNSGISLFLICLLIL